MSNIATLIEKSVTTEMIVIRPNFIFVFIACEDFPSFRVQSGNTDSHTEPVSLRHALSANLDDESLAFLESPRQPTGYWRP